MEFKKKTIIGEDNNEPPKDYIGIKSDGKAYEYSYSQRKGIESKSVSGGSGGSGGGEGTAEDTTIAHTVFWPMQYLPIAMCLESELWNEINNQNPDWNRIESHDPSYVFSLENVNLYYTHEDIEHLGNETTVFLYPEEEFELHPEYEINGIGGPGFTNDSRINGFLYGNIPIKVKINNKVYVTMMYSD